MIFGRSGNDQQNYADDRQGAPQQAGYPGYGQAPSYAQNAPNSVGPAAAGGQQPGLGCVPQPSGYGYAGQLGTAGYANQPGTVFRLKGKGIKHLRAERYGDLFVTMNVVVPKKLSEEQKELIRQMEGISEPQKKDKKSKGIFKH